MVKGKRERKPRVKTKKKEEDLRGYSQNLSGMWFFKLDPDGKGEKEQWYKVEHEDSNWSKIFVPGSWEEQGYIDYDGYAWYRLRFNIPKEWEGQGVMVILESVDDRDTTYFNGERIGETTRVQEKRRYIVSPKLIRYGKENVIAVQVYDSGGGGGITGPVEIKRLDSRMLPGLITLKLRSNRLGNIFYEKDPLDINLEISNFKNMERRMWVQYKITNYHGKTVGDGDFPVKIPAGGKVFHRLELDRKEVGIFYVQVQVKEYRVSVQKELRFGIIPRPKPGFKKRSAFGMVAFLDTMKNGGVLMEQAGIKWLRMPIRWCAIEHPKGNFHWKHRYDKIIKEARTHNIEILGLLGDTPAWAAAAPPNVTVWWEKLRYPPRNISDWTDFITKIVNRYKDKIKYWEIWNEQNSSFFFGGTVKDYVEMLKSAYLAAKKVDPDCQIVLGGLVSQMGEGIKQKGKWEITGVATFLRELHNLGGEKYFDIMNIHLYGGSATNFILKKLESLRKLMKAYSIDKKVWVTEIGWSTTDVNEKRQAENLVKSYVLCLSTGIVDKVFWFNLRCGPDAEKGISNFGIINHDYSPRLAYVAYANMSKRLEGAEYKKKIKLDNVEAYIFEKDEGFIAVLWGSGLIKIGKVKVFDMVGNPIEVKEGRLKVTSEPVFIEGMDLKQLGEEQ